MTSAGAAPPAVEPSQGALRVLHCIPSVWPGSGGPTRAVVEMCRATSAVDPHIRVDIVSTDYRLTSEWRATLERQLPAGSRLHILHATNWPDAGASPELVRWLWHNIERYDVLHLHALLNSVSAAAAWVARRHGVPYIVRPLGTLSPYTYSYRRRLRKHAFFRLVDRPTIAGAAAIHYTAPQEATKAERLRLPTSSTVIPIPFPGAVRRPSALDSDIVLFMGRLHPVKGLDLLLEAFARVHDERPAARLVIAGAPDDPAYERELRSMAARLGVADVVEFTGFVHGKEKERLLATASVYVQPSHQENFGVALVEALAHSLPVVTTNEVDLWPDVASFGSGLVVAPDAAEIASALLRMLADPDLRSTMGARGAVQVRERYAPSIVGAQLASLYERVRHPHHRPRPERATAGTPADAALVLSGRRAE